MNKPNFRLSIIIPAYITNQKGLDDFKELIKKIVLHKDFTKNQLIVIDDGSTVKEGGKWLFSEKFIQNYFSPHDIIRYIEPNSGVAFARNVGIHDAEGDYIVFIDADDDVPENFIKILEDRIAQEDANGNKNDIIQFQAKHEDGNIAFPEPCAWGKLIKRSWIGDDRFDENQLIGEEDTLFHKEGKTAVIAHDDRIIYYHRQSANPDSLMKRFWRGEVPRRRDDR